MFRRNVPASRFFSKRGSRCPGSHPSICKKKFSSLGPFGSWSAGCQNRPLVQWICTGLQICKRRFNPLYRATEFFLHFLSLGSATHRSFLHFLSLNLQKKIFHLLVCIWFLVSRMSELATGPVDMHWTTDLQA